MRTRVCSALAFLLLLLLTSRARGAAVVTCTQPGYSDTVLNGVCHGATGNTLAYEGATGVALQGGAFTAFGRADPLNLPDATAGPFPLAATATWDDIFYLPSSAAGDVLKISVFGAGLFHPASIQIAGINYTTSNFCDAHFAGNPACTATETVPASAVSFVDLKGMDSVSFPMPCIGSCGLNLNSDLYESVTVSRFAADGVTPDPFTNLVAAPEPSSAGLCFSLVLLALMRLRPATGALRATTVRK